MKKYALRLENPYNVLGHLVRPGTRDHQVVVAYDQFIKELTAALAQCAVERVEIEVHDFAALDRYKASLIDEHKEYLNFDSQGQLGVAFGVSRRFELESGKQLGITSRPGYDELEQQISRIASKVGGSVGIIEDDIYTGGTLRHTIQVLKQHSISVHSIISGISSTRQLDDLPVQSCIYYEPENLLELTDPRDYIFGAKDGGLVVTFVGRKCRVPYCLPFSDVVKRSSIARECARDFSSRVIEANYALHESIGSLSYPTALFFPKEVLTFVGLKVDDTLKDAFKKLQNELTLQ